MEIQKERADKRRAEAAVERVRRFDVFFDTIVQEKYVGAVRRACRAARVAG